MSQLSIELLPEVLRNVRTRLLFVLRLAISPYQIIGFTPGATRRVGIVPQGNFVGPRLSGEVLHGGNDWQTVREDRTVALDVRLVLKTNDGDLIGMIYRGLRHGPVDVVLKLDRGEDVDPAEYYFRILPQFETSSKKYDWMNRVLAIGIGYRLPDAVIYSVFEIL
jgi:hypothetical protein